jgi:hypothetical protein
MGQRRTRGIPTQGGVEGCGSRGKTHGGPPKTSPDRSKLSPRRHPPRIPSPRHVYCAVIFRPTGDGDVNKWAVAGCRTEWGGGSSLLAPLPRQLPGALRSSTPPQALCWCSMRDTHAPCAISSPVRPSLSACDAPPPGGGNEFTFVPECHTSTRAPFPFLPPLQGAPTTRPTQPGRLCLDSPSRWWLRLATGCVG